MNRTESKAKKKEAPTIFISVKEAQEIAKEKGLNLSSYQVRYMATKKGIAKQITKWGRWYVDKSKWEELINAN